MNSFYENIDSIADVVDCGDEFVTVPTASIDGAPYRIANLPVDEIVFASSETVVRDYKTGALMIDVKDVALGLPSTEWELRQSPAVMRAAVALGDTALDGFLVDYRHIGRPRYRDAGLEYGTDSERFQELQEEYGTLLPVGALFNTGGRVEYRGKRAFLPAAESMGRRVDAFIKSADLYPHTFTLPSEIGDIEYDVPMSGSSQSDIVHFESRPISASTSEGLGSVVNFAWSLVGLAVVKAIDKSARRT